jgi:hypothetical protein
MLLNLYVSLTNGTIEIYKRFVSSFFHALHHSHNRSIKIKYTHENNRITNSPQGGVLLLVVRGRRHRRARHIRLESRWGFGGLLGGGPDALSMVPLGVSS